jgi:hypothetical protein
MDFQLLSEEYHFHISRQRLCRAAGNGRTYAASPSVTATCENGKDDSASHYRAFRTVPFMLRIHPKIDKWINLPVFLPGFLGVSGPKTAGLFCFASL